MTQCREFRGEMMSYFKLSGQETPSGSNFEMEFEVTYRSQQLDDQSVYFQKGETWDEPEDMRLEIVDRKEVDRMILANLLEAGF